MATSAAFGRRRSGSSCRALPSASPARRSSRRPVPRRVASFAGRSPPGCRAASPGPGRRPRARAASSGEINTTAMPLSRTRLIVSSTFLVCTTPERGGRLVEEDDLVGPRDGPAMAIPCRWPPDIEPTGAVSDRTVRAELVERRPGPSPRIALLSMKPSRPSMPLRRQFPAQEHVLDGIEVRRQRQILVDDLDPELGGLRRTGQLDRLALEVDLARSRVRRLPESALTMVDLPAPLSPIRATTSPGVDVEVGVVQGPDMAEASRDAPEPRESVSPRYYHHLTTRGANAPRSLPARIT